MSTVLRRTGLVGALGFLVLMGLAFVLYTREHPHQNPLLVFFSDLLADKDSRGRSNHGPRWLAIAAIVSLAVSLVSGWLLVARHSSRRLANWIQLGAGLACAGLLAVGLTTAGGLWWWHDRLILLTGPVGLVTLLLSVTAQLRAGRVGHAATALVAVLLGSWNLAQYVRQTVLYGPRWPELAVVQKCAALALTAWLALTLLDSTTTRNSKGA